MPVGALARLVAPEEGQDLTEYALLAVLIAVAAVVAITGLGQTEWFGWKDILDFLSPIFGG